MSVCVSQTHGQFSYSDDQLEVREVDQAEFSSLEAARHPAITTATNIVSEAMAEGEVTSAIEVQIFEDHRLVSRQVVTLSVAEFTTGE